MGQVGDGRAFRKEFGIGKDFEANGGFAGMQDARQGGGGAHGQRALFHHDGVGCGVLQNQPGRLFPVLQVGRVAGALAEGLGGRVDADKDDVRLGDGGPDVRREE